MSGLSVLIKRELSSQLGATAKSHLVGNAQQNHGLGPSHDLKQVEPPSTAMGASAYNPGIESLQELDHQSYGGRTTQNLGGPISSSGGLENTGL